MKFIWQEGYDQMKSIVSRCWLEPNGHGLPPAFTSVLAGCQVGLHRVVYSASVDELGKWHFPEFQGDEEDVAVLFWMPKPDVSLRVDTGFAFNADMLEAVLYGKNRAAELAAMTKRAEAAELSLKLIEADNRDLIEAHRRIGELEEAREEAVTDSELAILENVKLKERIKELEADLRSVPVMELMRAYPAVRWYVFNDEIRIRKWVEHIEKLYAEWVAEQTQQATEPSRE